MYRVVTYDGACNRASNLVTITGLENELVGLKVYPNPANDVLHVVFHSSSPVQAILSDFLGRVMSVSDFNNSISISMNSLNNGIYLLKIKTGSGEIVKKIVVNR